MAGRVSKASGDHRTCPLCEAMCGVVIHGAAGRAAEVASDRHDVFSRGHLCPKASALVDIQHDPDRLRHPLRRRGGRWERVGWSAAIREAADRLADVQRRHGRDAVALYVGNPTTHNYATTLAVPELRRALGTRNVFSTASVDHLPHLFAAYHMFGNQAVLPVPDVDRTRFLLILGANPLVSNGSLMSAPGMSRRLRALLARGGRLVVVDPRRTETARLADTHLAIRPGTDVLLLLSLVAVLFEEGLVAPFDVAEGAGGLDDLRAAVEAYSPDRVAAAIGLPAVAVRKLARDFAAAESAACYGRLGVCTQRFGALSCWLVTVLNALTGNLDRVGGAMFTTPAVDLVRLAELLGEAGSFARWRSRIRGAPEFGGELPLAVLAEEVETPGEGQVRGLITVAGNPALSAPAAPRLARALSSLEVMISVDCYLNETTRHADLILPAAAPLERDHYDLLLNALAVRNVARYTPRLRPPEGESREDWRILTDLAGAVARRAGTRAGWMAVARAHAVRVFTPRRILALALRLGPHRLSLRQLERSGRTVDLGPLQPGRLADILAAARRPFSLAPAPMLADIPRVDDLLRAPAPSEALLLIGRRQMRDNNSWLHNVPRLMRGPLRCTLQMNPDDARDRGLRDGQQVTVRSDTGALAVQLAVTPQIRPGAVSLPHGYGHGLAGTRLRVANQHPGVSVNCLTDDAVLDPLSGTSRLNGFPVTVVASESSAPSPVAATVPVPYAR